jgi:hypothetical protein
VACEEEMAEIFAILAVGGDRQMRHAQALKDLV